MQVTTQKMTHTKFLLLFASVFAITLALTALGSAACLNLTNINAPDSVAHDAGSFDVSFSLVHDGTCDNQTGLNWGYTSNIISSMDDPAITTIDANKTVTGTAKFHFPANRQGEITFTITLDTAEGESFTFPMDSVTITGSSTLKVDNFVAPTSTSQGTLRLKNTGNTALTGIDFATSGNIGITFSPTSISNLAPGATTTITLSVSNSNDLEFGLNPTTITATSDEGASATTSEFTIRKTFCSAGTVGNLQIKKLDINNIDGNDEDWEILDEIEVEVEVENTGTEDIDNVEVRLGLFDRNGNDLSDEFDWSNSDEETIELGDLRDGRDDKVLFTFRIPATFAEFGEGDYMLAIKAYGEDEALECVDEDTNEFSNDFFESVNIQLEEDEGLFVIVDDVKFDSDTYTCSETVSGEFTVFNVGDVEQDRIKVTMTNSALDVDQTFEITRGLDVGEDKTVQFSFNLPSNAKNGAYNLEFETEYEYDDGDYDQISDETFGEETVFTLAACQGGNGDNGNDNGGAVDAEVDAELTSDAVAGEELEIELTITNTGSSESTFVLNAVEYQSWATLGKISDRILTLDAGESETVTITLNANEGVSGTQSFSVEVTEGSETETTDVEVRFGSEGGFDFGNLGGSSLIWIIGIVNVVLILLIIIVAIRLAKR